MLSSNTYVPLHCCHQETPQECVRWTTLMNTHPAPPFRDQMTLETLAPCAWRYVLTMDDLASFRLLTRSDVVGRWDIASTTFFHFYCKVKLTISAQCFTPPVSKSGRSYNGQLSDKADSIPVVHTRTLLLSPEATWLTKSAFAALKKDTTQPTGASKAYRRVHSQESINSRHHYLWVWVKALTTWIFLQI